MLDKMLEYFENDKAGLLNIIKVSDKIKSNCIMRDHLTTKFILFFFNFKNIFINNRNYIKMTKVY